MTKRKLEVDIPAETKFLKSEDRLQKSVLGTRENFDLSRPDVDRIYRAIYEPDPPRRIKISKGTSVDSFRKYQKEGTDGLRLYIEGKNVYVEENMIPSPSHDLVVAQIVEDLKALARAKGIELDDYRTSGSMNRGADVGLQSRSPDAAMAVKDQHIGPTVLIEVSLSETMEHVAEKAVGYLKTSWSNVQTVICVDLEYLSKEEAEKVDAGKRDQKIHVMVKRRTADGKDDSSNERNLAWTLIYPTVKDDGEDAGNSKKFTITRGDLLMDGDALEEVVVVDLMELGKSAEKKARGGRDAEKAIRGLPKREGSTECGKAVPRTEDDFTPIPQTTPIKRSQGKREHRMKTRSLGRVKKVRMLPIKRRTRTSRRGDSAA